MNKTEFPQSLTTIMKWLAILGLDDDSIERVWDPFPHLEVFLYDDQRIQYLVRILPDDKFVNVESVVFDAASGDPSGETQFYQTILACNMATNTVRFAIAPIGERWVVISRAVVPARILDARFISEAIRETDLIRNDFVPRLEEISAGFRLTHNGHLSPHIRGLVDSILKF